MSKKILINVENRLLKGLLLKSISNANMTVLDVIDIDDLNLKLDIFGSEINLAVFEITDKNKDTIKTQILRVKGVDSATHVLAVVSKDTYDIVSFATRLGIKDLLYLPKNRELYRKIIEDKMESYYIKWNPVKQLIEPEKDERPIIIDSCSVLESLSLELKHAQRGNYQLTLVMACIKGQGGFKPDMFYESAKSCLRDTDMLLMLDENTFIGVLPYTQKEYAVNIERKFRDVFDKSFGKIGYFRLHLFSATYPYDDESLENLLERLNNGINSSIVVDSIKTPLNKLSNSEIENYKRKLKQYRRFM